MTTNRVPILESFPTNRNYKGYRFPNVHVKPYRVNIKHSSMDLIHCYFVKFIFRINFDIRDDFIFLERASISTSLIDEFDNLILVFI